MDFLNVNHSSVSVLALSDAVALHYDVDAQGHCGYADCGWYGGTDFYQDSERH